MAELEQGLEELKVVKKAFKDNFDNEDVSTNNVEFRNMPNLLKQMEKKLPTQTKEVAPSTSAQTITPDSGYKLSQVNIKAVVPSDYYKPEQVLSVSPKITSQTITPSANYVYNKVNINAVTSTIDSNIIPTNIRKGTSILGVQGNLEADKPDQSKVINPTTSTQIVVGDTGYELAKVTVNAVTNAIDSNIKAENIKQGVSILGVDGTFEGAKQPNLQEKNIEPATIYQSIVPDNGYDGLSKVNISAVTNSIDSNIQPQNIKKGITILGVNGTMQATSGSPKFSQLIDGTIETIDENDLSEPTSIKDYTFYYCKNLTSAVVPSNITSIGASAFEGCSSLQTLVIADGVQNIGVSAFKGINASIINIPSTISVLQSEVFANNTALTSITIPNNITEIKDYVFNGCTNLTEITMESYVPISVTENTFPANVTAIYVKYGAYNDYVANWTFYADKIVRLPAILSTLTITTNNHLGELVGGAVVTIEGNGQTYVGITDDNGVFVQGDLQPATYTISVADIEGFKTPNVQEVVVEENSKNSIVVTYLEKPAIVASRVFAENSPSVISYVADEISSNNMTSAQVAETYGWNLGDKTSITLSTGENIEMQIIGFNHDNKSDGGGKAGITLQMVNCLATLYDINSDKTNAGGYASSKMKTETLPTFKATFPQEWQDVIKFVDKKSANGGSTNYSETLTTSDDLFILSQIEVFGMTVTTAQDHSNEGSVYEYWNGKVNSDRIKKYDSNADGVVDADTAWWIRSCNQYSTNYFVSVSKTGANGTNLATNKIGISFAFCV